MSTALVKEVAGTIYVASRASIPERPAMWRRLRDAGWQINSSWIDEAGDGETLDFTDLWERVAREISEARRVVLYAETSDFPLKGALVEVGIAMGMDKEIVVCLPGVDLEERSKRPIGSWIAHPNVRRIDNVEDALAGF
jgi:hypothetical protein